MTGPRSEPASKGAASRCRGRRRREYERRASWVRPLRRAHRALIASSRLVISTLYAVRASKQCVEQQPIRTSRRLQSASALLIDASARLVRAAEALRETNQCIGRHPDDEDAADVPQMVVETTESWAFLAEWINEVSDNVFAFQSDVLHGLATGTLVAEPEDDKKERRPRIILAPRPVPVRAFLAARQPRVADRIASLLSRRRRTPRPAAVTVPRRSHTGRAPPLSSTCLL